MRRTSTVISVVAFAATLRLASVCPAAPPRNAVKVWVAPLSGTDDASARQMTDALKAAIQRGKAYAVVTPPTTHPATMDATEPATMPRPIDFDTPADEVRDRAGKAGGAKLLIWGDLAAAALSFDLRPDAPATSGTWNVLRLKLLDVRDADPEPLIFVQTPGDGGASKAIEKAVAFLLGPPPPPATQPVVEVTGPDLLPDGDFAVQDRWTFVRPNDRGPVKFIDMLPESDRPAIYRVPARDGEPAIHALTINLSGGAANNNSVAVYSELIPVPPDAGAYRLGFRYKSAGPSTRVIVKGYGPIDGAKPGGPPSWVYRTSALPVGPTDGEWADVDFAFDVRRGASAPVTALKLEIGGTAAGGTIFFSDVRLSQGLGSEDAAGERSEERGRSHK